MSGKVIFRQDIMQNHWGMAFGETVDFWMLLVHSGWLEATEEEKQDVDSCACWGDEA